MISNFRRFQPLHYKTNIRFYRVFSCNYLINMKILGICFPNDLFYTTLKNDQTSWYGQGIWSILKIMDLVHDPHLKIVTNLSSSSSTHPILQTVQDGKGTTHKQRHTYYFLVRYLILVLFSFGNPPWILKNHKDLLFL